MRGRSIVNTMVVVVSVMSAGCATGGSTDPGPAMEEQAKAPGQEVKLNAETRSEAKLKEQEEARRLAAQAERDVGELLRLRGDGEGEERTGAVAGAEPAAPGPTVVWNEPGRVRTGPRGSQARKEAMMEEGATISPLFRDPAEKLEVKEPGLAEAGDPGAAGGPGAADALAVEPLDLLMVKLRQELYQRSIDSDQPLRELIPLTAMAMVDPELELHPEFMRQLTDEERDLLRELQGFFASLGKNLDDSHEAGEVIPAAVEDLKARIIEQPVLELPTSLLCWRVGGFGDYDEFEKCVFLAHAEQRVILYLEIDGFSSERNKKGQWVTEISQQLEIISDDDKIPVWSEPWQKAPDVSNQKRRDFFTTQIITLPQALSVGRYALKVRARDEKSGAEAETTIDFEMVADERLAAQVPQ